MARFAGIQKTGDLRSMPDKKRFSFSQTPDDVDLTESNRIVHEVLDRTIVLNETQKKNIHLKAADLWQRRLIWKSVPFRILFEFNRRCNANCIHCYVEHDEEGELSPDILKALLDEIGWGVMEIMPLALSRTLPPPSA